MSDEPKHLCCPFCQGYEVDRLFLASLDMDSCVCTSCGARWDEHRGSGEYAGRGRRSSVIAPRTP